MSKHPPTPPASEEAMAAFLDALGLTAARIAHIADDTTAHIAASQARMHEMDEVAALRLQEMKSAA